MTTPAGPADTAAVRRHNLALVLRYVAAHGPCARTEIAGATGLVHASVTGLATELIERGLVREVGSAATGGRGRPRRLLQLVPERVMAIAVQVTLERLEVTAADLDGTAVHRASAVHRAPFGDPEPLAAAIAREIKLAADAVREVDGAYLSGAVIAMAGPVTGPGHTIAAAIDFGWPAQTDLRGLVAAHLPDLGCPLDVVNDANCAALAEYHAHGAARELPDTVAYIKADTGVGGGLLIGGRIHTGSTGLAGEAGHIPIDLDGPPCACGARGCLALAIGPEPLTAAAGLADLAARDGIDAALAELDRRLALGDPHAVAALADAGRSLGAAILAISGLTGAAEIILGGYLAGWCDRLTPGIDTTLAGRRAVAPHLGFAITPGLLGPAATLTGALLTTREATLADPTSVPPV
ncbi:ROK family transcriptional regulator [Yinghuangia soli]|uniref:ROK family transcriptional regulator n=1 Tax=Yinghuangia soli TaxID=2908204 RepID=A0AA41PWK8_9ACTN|nr:ROK family transcriptional regulator [Yinghuangia soli]MCF2526912.1 ROK family transcriptional regulator [Yinghuangia soli]